MYGSQVRGDISENSCRNVSDPDPDWNPNSNGSEDPNPDWESGYESRQTKIVPQKGKY
jgi:hypothetical protein